MDLSVVITTAPNTKHSAVEAFDLAISGAVFDWQISLFFVGPGLVHCCYQPPTPGSDDLNKRWMSASLFGVEQLYRLTEEDWPKDVPLAPIADQVMPISRAGMQNILATSRRVMVI